MYICNTIKLAKISAFEWKMALKKNSIMLWAYNRV